MKIFGSTVPRSSNKKIHRDILAGLNGTGTNSNYLSIPSLASYAVPDNWTMQFWLKPPVSGTKDNEGLFCSNITNTTLNWFNLSVSNTSNGGRFIAIDMRDSAGTAIISGQAITINPSSNNHFESLRNGQNKERILITISQTKNLGTGKYEYRTYCNKFLRYNTLVATAKCTTWTGFNFFTDRGVASRNSNFQIGNFRFYNGYVMSDTEVANSYNDGYGANPVIAPTVNIPFNAVDQVSANYYVRDISGNGNDVQINGFASPLTSISKFKDDDLSGRIALFVDGNSMVANGLGLEWATYSKAYFSDSYYTANFGVSTTSIQDLIIAAPTKFDFYLYHVRNWGKKHLVFWEGSNDLHFFNSVSTCNADYLTYVNARRAAGFQKLMNLTIIARGADYAGFNTDRVTVNNAQKALTPGSWDAYYDIGVDANFQDPTNTTYYQGDQVHPVTTANGYPYISNNAKNIAVTM